MIVYFTCESVRPCQWCFVICFQIMCVSKRKWYFQMQMMFPNDNVSNLCFEHICISHKILEWVPHPMNTSPIILEYSYFKHIHLYNSWFNRMVNLSGLFDGFYRMFTYVESLLTLVGVELVKYQLVTRTVSVQSVSNFFYN